MKVLLFLIVSGISTGSNIPFKHQTTKQYSDLKECVQASITLRKVLHAEDNLQAYQTDVYAYCEVEKKGLSPDEFSAATNKIRRLEKFYSTAKW
jgi:hypothetical protein